MRFGFFLTAAIGCFWFQGSAYAQDGNIETAAQQAFERGTAAHKADKFAEAVNAFTEAYRLRPSWKILYNIGQDNAAMKRYGEALEAFERYLVDGGDEILAERKDEVNNEIARLKNMVGYLKVTAPDGTMIYVNGVKRGVAPFTGELPVNAVPNQAVRAEFIDDSHDERFFSVNSGRTVFVDFMLPAQPKKALPKSEPTSIESTSVPPPTDSQNRDMNDRPNSSHLKVLGWTSFGVGSALLIGGAVTGGLALADNADLENSCTQNGCYSKDYDQLDGRNNLATASTVLLATGGIAAAVGIGLLIFGRVKSKKSETQHTAWLIGPGGWVLQGRF